MDQTDVQGDPGSHRQRREKLTDERDIKRANHRLWERRFKDERRSATHIYDRFRQRFVHRDDRMAESFHLPMLRKDFLQRVPDNQAGVLDYVVEVHLSITLSSDP